MLTPSSIGAGTARIGLPFGAAAFLVDDDEMMGCMLEATLTQMGLEVTRFTDPRLAIAALRNDPTACALIVTDLNMPAMSGADLCAAASQVQPAPKRVIVSGDFEDAQPRAALDFDAHALIPKRMAPEALPALILVGDVV